MAHETRHCRLKLPTAFVWLYVGNDAPKERFVAKGVYFNSIKGTFQCFPGVVDGELGFLEVCQRDMLCKGTHPRKVKSGVHIVDGISDDQAQTQSHILEIREHVFQLLMAGVEIILDRRSVSIFHRANSGIQVCDMMIGPLKLEPCVPEAFHE
jgi:hypothetical protein